jgi:hypothetical protein
MCSHPLTALRVAADRGCSDAARSAATTNWTKLRDRSEPTFRMEGFARPNVRAKPRAEADADWPRKDNDNDGLERPGGGCRSASA